MTRLKTEWIDKIAENICEWNDYVEKITKKSILEIAAAAGGMAPSAVSKLATSTNTVVVPMTCGQGVIDTFSESVAAIVRSIGFKARVSPYGDVSGIFDGIIQGDHLFFAADDDRYIAYNVKNRAVGENDIATARGYIEVLDAMECKKSGSGIAEKKVLVLGYGRIGKEMCNYLKIKKTSFVVYDKDPVKKEELRVSGIEQLDDISDIKRHRLILDATCEGDWLSCDMLADNVLIAAPGVPLSLDRECCKKLEGQYIHDNLEIGTAVMAVMALGGNDE